MRGLHLTAWFFLVALQSVPLRAYPQSPVILVQGIVANANTGDPVPSAQVRLSTTRPGEFRPMELTAFTSSDGKFQIAAPAGEYTILAQRPGYFGPAVHGVPKLNDTRKLTVVAGIENQKLSLVPGGVITGRIFDQAGNTPARMTISAVQMRFDNGRPSVVRVRSADTNELGEYRIYWVPPGDYFVMFEPGLTSVASPTIVGPNSAIPTRTYFPGSTRLDSARLITVGPGNELDKIDFTLQTTPSFKVSGRVVNPYAPAGGPPPEISALPNFTLVNSDFSVQEIVISPFGNSAPLSDRQAGLFELRGIPPGHYELFASVRTPAFAVTHTGNISVDVTTQDVKDLVVTVRPPADLKGRLIVSGNLQLPEKTKVGLRYIGSPRISPLLETEADASGEFSFRGLPNGLYRISADAPANAFVSDVRQGDRSIYGDNLVRIGGDAPLPVEIAFASDAGTISGAVIHPEGRNGTDTAVVLIPDAARANVLLYRTAHAQESGQFTLSNIAPGRYKLFAWEGARMNMWLDAAFVARYEDQGAVVNIRSGANGDVRIPAIWLK